MMSIAEPTGELRRLVRSHGALLCAGLILRLLLGAGLGHPVALRPYWEALAALDPGGPGLAPGDWLRLLWAYPLMWLGGAALPPPAVAASLDWSLLARYGGLPRVLLAAKIPIFLADAALLALWWRRCGTGHRRRIALLWAFNPLVLYGGYVIGSSALVPAVLAFWGLDRFASGAVSTGAVLAVALALCLDPLALLLLLPAVPLLWRDPAFGTSPLALLAPFALVGALLCLLGLAGSWSWEATLTTVARWETFLGATLTINDHVLVRLQDRLPLVLFGLSLCTLWLALGPARSRRHLGPVLLVALGLVVALTPVPPGRVQWIVPWAGLWALERPKRLGLLGLLALILPLYAMLWGRPYAADLLAPLVPEGVAAMRAPAEVLADIYDADKLMALLRTALSALAFALALAAWRELQPVAAAPAREVIS